jgi:hypothetical protein
VTATGDDRFLSDDVRKKVRKTWQHRLVFTNIMISHLVGALIIIGCMEITEAALKWFHVGPAFEGLPFAFPVRWVINAADISILIGFLGRGAYVAVKSEAEA